MNNNDYKEVLFYAASIFNERMGTEFSEDKSCAALLSNGKSARIV